MNERLTPANIPERPALASNALNPALAVDAGGELDGPSEALPGGHPLWQRDGLAISARARAVLVALQPVVVRVLSFWDHVARSARIGARTIEIDPSGCYRVR